MSTTNGTTKNRVRVRRSEAAKKYSGLKTRAREHVDPTMRKVVVSYSLPVWQVEWVESMAESKGMHRSTFMAAVIEAHKAGLDGLEMDADRLLEMAPEDDDEG